MSLYTHKCFTFRANFILYLGTSVTSLGDLFDFWKLFKACGNNYFSQMCHILSEIIFGQLLLTFSDFVLVTLLGTLNASGDNCPMKSRLLSGFFLSCGFHSAKFPGLSSLVIVIAPKLRLTNVNGSQNQRDQMLRLFAQYLTF